MKRQTLFVLALILIVPVAAFAGGAGESEPVEDEPVVLDMYHWFGPEMRETIEEINGRFTAETGIEVSYESAPTDQYRNVIKIKLASGDAPDIFGVFPGTEVVEFSDAGHLANLSGQGFMDRVMEGATVVTRGSDGDVYALPLDQNVIGVVYNRAIFNEVGLDVPTSWDEFLSACRDLKDAGYYPLALGNADLWVTQLIPYAMASIIYKEIPNFDAEMYAGERSFNGPEWRAVMEAYMELQDREFFHPGVLSTTYDQTIQLMALEQAAMVVNGNWIIAGIREANPDLDLGMFPFPSVEAGETAWISGAVGIAMGAFADSENLDAAMQYLEFWTRPEIISDYLMAKKAFSTIKGVSVDFDPAAGEIGGYLAETNTYPFPDQNWPSGVQDVFLKGYQAVFAGEMTIPEMLQSVDDEWAARTAQ